MSVSCTIECRTRMNMKMTKKNTGIFASLLQMLRILLILIVSDVTFAFSFWKFNPRRIASLRVIESNRHGKNKNDFKVYGSINAVSNNVNGNDDTVVRGGKHLVDAGRHICAGADFVGPSNYACLKGKLLKDAGESIIELGTYWTTNWEVVTYEADDASKTFHALSQLMSQTNQNHPDLAKLYSAASGELREIASIVGCTLVGPPSAVPNLEGLSKRFNELAVYIQKECSDDDDDGGGGGECSIDDGTAFSEALRNASGSIKALAKEYYFM